MVQNNQNKVMIYRHNFKVHLEYDIKKVQKNQVGLKLNGTCQLLVYAGDVNLLRVDIDIVGKNIEAQQHLDQRGMKC
jgi:hypothetical protein